MFEYICCPKCKNEFNVFRFIGGGGSSGNELFYIYWY